MSSKNILESISSSIANSQSIASLLNDSDSSKSSSSHHNETSLEGDKVAMKPSQNYSGGKTINAEDTFITIQTKDGQSSQKIPFYQFLEQIVGTKLKSNIHLDISSIMNSNTCITQHGNNDNLSSEKLKEDSDVADSPSINQQSDPESKGMNLLRDEKDFQVKSRGRGRPRKLRSKNKNDQLLKKATKDTKDKHKREILEKPKGSGKFPSSSLSQVSAIADFAQSPRRSRRTPARNSRFKEDFVDSSTLWSKGSSSWNTQLMTLALAAERHETKPNKQPYSSRKKNALANLEISNSNTGKTEAKTLNPKDCINMTFGGSEDCIAEQTPIEKQSEVTTGISHVTNSEHEFQMSTQVIKRPLDVALEFVLKELHGALSENVEVGDVEKQEKACCAQFYTIMEPKLEVPRDAFLIERNDNGTLNFNVANIIGQKPSQNLNSVALKYPPDRLFACGLCDLIFPSTNAWNQHNKKIHEKSEGCLKNSNLDKDVYQCPLCDEKFPFEFMLDNHMEKGQHGEDAVYSCNMCGIFFFNAKEQKQHWFQSHVGHTCMQCGKYFDNVVMLRRHLRDELHHPGTVNNLNPANNTAESPKARKEEEVFEEDAQMLFTDEEQNFHGWVSPLIEKIPCDLCSSKFSTYSGLWHHKLEVHQQFFPPGFKHRLLEKLENNESIIKSTQTLDSVIPKDDKKKKYFTVMQPKWSNFRSKLKVSMDNREIRFSVMDGKDIKVEEKGSMDNQSDAKMDKNTVFECNQCGESFQFAANYREHCSQIHGECFEIIRYLGAFQCLQCSDTFPCQFMLEEHLKLHDERKSLPCTLCHLSFHRIQERREHWKKSHPGVSCPNCGKMYTNLKHLQKHISLNCQDYYPTSKRLSDLQKKQSENFENHQEEKRVEKKILKCHLCPKICSSIHCWRRHMSENHENDGFSKLSNTCIICNKVIYGYKALEKHLLEEHAEESGLPIEQENTMVKEALKKSKMDIIEYRKAGKDQDSIFQDEEGLYHCPECPKTHPDLKALMIHIKTHVNMQLECSVCHKTFKNPTLLKQHVMRHRTKAVYNCSTCGKRFVTLQKLNKHNKVHHSKENFVCELCGMSFALNDYLLKHKRCHTDKRPHSCSVCGKSFRTKPELRIHVLIHTQETPYVCDHCGRGFTQKGNWRIHLAQHTGVKPHKCNQCDLSFALPSHLKRHLVTHDQKVNYRCIWCDKECTQRKHMQMHVSRVHKEDFFQYEEQMKLEVPIPIAPSQLKMYNRRLNKAGQVRKAYRTRAKKCSTSSQDIIKGAETVDNIIDNSHGSENLSMETIIEPMVETVTTDLGLTHQDINQDNGLQILVSRDHQNYAKHNVTGELIGDDASNVEIVMGDNHEINIIINNNETSITSDMSVQESLEEGATPGVSLAQFSEHNPQLHSSLQQAVNVLVSGSNKGFGGEENMTLDIDSLGHGTDTYAVVYPS